MSRVFSSLLDILFPPKCTICKKPVEASHFFCSDCATPLANSRCLICGEGHDDCYCDFYFDRLIAPFKYSGKLRGRIIQLKQQVRPQDVIAMTNAMAALYRRQGLDCQAIVPVPASRASLKKRGYNQAEVLANRLGKLLGLPVEKNILMRTEASLIQHSLSRSQRFLNADTSYHLAKDPSRLEYRSVLLVDDISTTGATLNACSKALRQGGAENIIALTAASTVIKNS